MLIETTGKIKEKNKLNLSYYNKTLGSRKIRPKKKLH